MTTFNHLIEYLDIFRILSDPKSKYAQIILKHADKKLVNNLCELTYNILLNNINISEYDRKELFKSKLIIKKLLSKINLKRKRKILSQKGGFLQYILPAVITSLGSIISSAIDKK